ncbi:MAG: hypothetical protein GX796_11150 [Clostridiaceae bacterium]|nr:hypothetical protein [Clostridiaceae bacterium]
MKIFKEDSSKESSEYGKLDCVNIPRRVGFDRIVLSLSVESIDWGVLNKKLQDEKTYQHRSVSVNNTSDAEQALSICNGSDPLPWVSSVRVTINTNVLSIRKCNIPGREDICLFEIHIKPITGYEYLGNISNNTCEEEKNLVKELMMVIKGEYGICFREGYSVLREAEININMKINREEEHLIGPLEILGPYQSTIKGFYVSRFGIPEENKPTISESDLCDLPGVQVTSAKAESATRIIKLYDKAYETQSKIDIKEKRQITYIENLCRLEYVIKKKEEIEVYFRGKTNLFDLTQEDVEYAYRKLTKELMKKPLDEYYHKYDKAIEDCFEHIDIIKMGWRNDLIWKIVKALNKKNVNYYNVTDEELRFWVSLIKAPSVKAHGARISSSIKKEIDKLDGCFIRVTKGEKEYIPLINWLCGIDREEEQKVFFKYE